MTDSVVLLHAHPDDEAIFTGGVMALLADRGVAVTLVVATDGGAGRATNDSTDLSAHRWNETLTACEALGVSDVVSLGYGDSGMGDAPYLPGTFAAAPVIEAAERFAQILRERSATCVISYDSNGIYGHPDHIQAHRVAAAACELVGPPTRYDVTVDREYLHFVETHLVVEAGAPVRIEGRGLASTDLGMPSVLIDLELDVTSVLDQKRRAMAAHSSQIDDASSAMRLLDADFAAVYGWEWYIRQGPPGVLETL